MGDTRSMIRLLLIYMNVVVVVFAHILYRHGVLVVGLTPVENAYDQGLAYCVFY